MKKYRKNNFSILTLIILMMSSCKSYKQDLMFRLDDEFSESDLAVAVQAAERNYIIRKNDFLRLDVFTNEGERIIDPNFELMQGAVNQNFMQGQRQFQYLVQEDGKVKLPILGPVSLEGLTLFEAESKLEDLYDEFYKDSFVKLGYLNKRVIVLGASGGLVVPLQNENTSLFEAIALAGGIGPSAKAHNIRLIRGDYKNPEVYQIDLSKVSTMRKSMITLKPGDVIYIEPWKRPVLDGIRDIAPILSLVTSVITLYIVIANL